MSFNIKYSKYNDYSILVEWPDIIDEIMLKNILNFKNAIQKKYIKQKVEVISAYNSILIIYGHTIENFNDKISELKALFLEQGKLKKIIPSVWEIPVCYDAQFGIDLEDFSKQKCLSKSEIIKLHTETIYTVFFIGFLPGFLYLGGLDKRLFLDRKTTPNLNVKKGSVAIGGQQTGIYPQDSPGGWHVIGNSPINLFEVSENVPCKIKAGDKIKFVSVETSAYEAIIKSINESEYQLKPMTSNA